MENIHHIVEEYRHADFEKRLHMFLANPSLRHQFSEVDDWEMPFAWPPFLESQRKVFNVSHSFDFVLSWACGLLRRCCCPLSNE